MKQRLSSPHPGSGNVLATTGLGVWCWAEARWVLLALWCGVVVATAQLVVARAW